MPDQVYLYDCTLRDGTQGEDVSLSVSDKLQIARKLNNFGLHFIEGGWPGSKFDGLNSTQKKSRSWQNLGGS